MYTLKRTTTSFCRTRRTRELRYVFTAYLSTNAQHSVIAPFYLEQGLGDFLSPDAVKTIAVEYQQGLLTRLNEELATEPELKDKSVAQTVVSLGNDPKHVLAFNYASQALNNSFFFDNLLPLSKAAPTIDGSPAESHEHSMKTDLKVAIEDSFSSLDNLKSTMSAAALGMMGSGWVWLVCDETGDHLAVIPSYGPGTMLVRSRVQKYPEGLSEVSLNSRSLLQVLGERIGSQSAGGQTTQIPRNGGASKAKMLHTSSLINSPLYATSFAAPRFSQTPARLAPLEPLSPSHRYPQSPITSSHRYSSTYNEDVPRPEPADELDPLDNDTLPLERQPRPRTVAADNAALSTIRRDPTSPPFSLSSRLRGGQDDLSPLLCISVHEHMWLCGGYGILGKEEYLRRFWNFVDWGKVSAIHSRWRATGGTNASEYRPLSTTAPRIY